MIKVSLLLTFACISQWVYATNGLPETQGAVILTVSGNITHTNSGATAEFDLSMLQAMPQTTIVTKTPWTEGLNHFTGPKIEDLIQLLAGKGEFIEATALNGYKITIPMQDVNKYSIILALQHNGEVLSVRRRGPSWVIYPWSDMNLTRNHKFYTRSIWQVKSINIF
ncbi:MAG: hypothetical protein OFPI_34490 [Osedax symbiont Rs2]|nr:MAG: hypothetical protein OFPI_34490 [Osedax symbiont Rs2]